MIFKKRPDLKIRVYSSYEGLDHPNISYTQDLSEMLKYKIVVVGKTLPPQKYEKASQTAIRENIVCRTKFVLDYTVPFIPINLKASPEIKHLQIGLLMVTGKK